MLADTCKFFYFFIILIFIYLSEITLGCISCVFGSQPPAVETRHFSSLLKITVIFLGQRREYIEIDFSYDPGNLRLQAPVSY